MRTYRGLRPVRPAPGRSFPRPQVRPAALALAVAFLLGSVMPGEALAAPSATQRKLNALATRISRMETALETTLRRLDAMRKGVATAEARLRAARKGLVALTQGLYMGTIDNPGTLFNAASVTEFGDRIAYVEYLRAGDRDTLQRVAIERVNIQRRRKALDSVLARQRTLLRGLAKEQAALQRLFREEQERLRALERARRNSRRRASRSEPALIGGTGPFRVCPVDPPRAYSNDFGAPRRGHRHQGNDIIAPRGTPIRAPFNGRFYRNSSGSGGLQARVFGAQGYVFNGHLDSYPSLANNSRVTAGTVIGYVGNSGNARGGVTHNHFEWHPGGGRAVNPYRYLNLVC